LFKYNPQPRVYQMVDIVMAYRGRFVLCVEKFQAEVVNNNTVLKTSYILFLG